MENTVLEWRSLDVARAVIMTCVRKNRTDGCPANSRLQTKGIPEFSIDNIMEATDSIMQIFNFS